MKEEGREGGKGGREGGGEGRLTHLLAGEVRGVAPKEKLFLLDGCNLLLGCALLAPVFLFVVFEHVGGPSVLACVEVGLGD